METNRQLMKKQYIGIFGCAMWPVKVWDLGWSVAYKTNRKLRIKPYKTEDDKYYILQNYCGISRAKLGEK
jgi:hypothetical protein